VTALVGSSGSGKSTTIGLISAFYVPTRGKGLGDGIDLSTVRLDSYRTQLGVVLQESFLFDGTIRENVAFSRPDASEEAVMRACRIARVDELRRALKTSTTLLSVSAALNYRAGNGSGSRLRAAILAEPRILILDEATSSLDSESEQMIQQGLSYLMQGRTTFVIAAPPVDHSARRSILVVEQGQIVERGSHEELYALRGRYFELYTKQHGLESNLFLAHGEGGAAPVGDDVGPSKQNANEPAVTEVMRFLH